MNYANALHNARKIALAVCLSHGGILNTRQIYSKAFEHNLLLNKTIGNIIAIRS
jgi:hypothetical protein